MRKKIVVGVIIVLLAALAFGYWYTQTQDYKSRKLLKDWEMAYRNDTYGGSTPEETLQLFTDALKKGDTDLASKYFLVEEREKQKSRLNEIKNKNLIDQFIASLGKITEKYPLIKEKDDRYIFESYDDKKELILQADVGRSPNGRWKILNL